jgi:sugar phosphate isomerase/epimerase
LAIGAAVQPFRDNLWCATGPQLTFPVLPRERIAVASWPFRKFIDAPENTWARDPKVPGMDLTAFPALVVKRFGVHNIEPLDQHFHSTDAAYVLRLRQSVEKAGCRVVDIPCDVKASFFDTNPSQRKVAVGNGKRWVDIAAELGSPSIRTSISGPPNLSPDIDRTAGSLTELADYGASKNIVVALENDDNRTEDPFFIVKVLEKVQNPYLRALPDFCNSMMTHDQDFNNRAMEAMFSHAYNIAHMKDEEGDDAGHFHSVDVAKCFEIAKAQSYRGYFSMEWEGNGEPFGGTQKLIDETLRNLR